MPAAAAEEFHGTLEPFAQEAVYFVLTDRFVNGDPGNDHRDQGGDHSRPELRTFDIPLAPCDGTVGNVGYLGGDFRGLLDNAGYIRGMGFGAVWVTPIVDNPDEAFTGGDPVKWGGMFTDRGKTGFHGYWGVNFYKLDEHLPSAGLDFAGLTKGLKQHGLKTVLDIVCNNANHWLMEVAIGHRVPLGNGILTVDTEAQALARARGGAGGKGGDAARACLSLIELVRSGKILMARGLQAT